jgi:Cu+-exporting ATPase
MMLSFPDYFSGGMIEVEGLKSTFTWLSFLLSVPVLFYCAQEFFISAYKGFRQGIVNIDAPIAFATFVTFSRSYYEIVSQTGTGYLDSGTGIVFFMLIGRWFQDKTYDSISFDRNYRSFFPLGVTVLKEGNEESIPVTKLKKGDKIVIRNEEMIPVDALLEEGDASIDYSFVSGENTPVSVAADSTIFAGGKQIGSRLILSAINEVSQSYITQLWNNNELGQKKNKAESFIHPWARYFTILLFTVSISGFVFWSIYDPIKAFPALTTVLIVACPCTLLLSATFTFGNMLRMFGKKQFYLKNANVIESLSDVDSIILDKTGTITVQNNLDIHFEGTELSHREAIMIRTLAAQSSHPLSKLVRQYLLKYGHEDEKISEFHETAGKGIQGIISGSHVKMGSSTFVNLNTEQSENKGGSIIHIEINGSYRGKFSTGNQYREGLTDLIDAFRREDIPITILSGDNDNEKEYLIKLLGEDTVIKFKQTPQDKLNFVKQMQYEGRNVLMVGDGLNDAGALLQSNVGIAISDDSSRFTPASDAILNGNNLSVLNRLINYAKTGKKSITICFIISILYNIIGISFAVQAKLSPLIAAILMPISSISVVLLTVLLTKFFAWKSGLTSIKN